MKEKLFWIKYNTKQSYLSEKYKMFEYIKQIWLAKNYKERINLKFLV